MNLLGIFTDWYQIRQAQKKHCSENNNVIHDQLIVQSSNTINNNKLKLVNTLNILTIKILSFQHAQLKKKYKKIPYLY